MTKLLTRSLKMDARCQFCTSVMYGIYNPDHWIPDFARRTKGHNNGGPDGVQRQAYLFNIMMAGGQRRVQEAWRAIGQGTGMPRRGEVWEGLVLLLALLTLRGMCAKFAAGDFRSIRPKYVPRGKPAGLLARSKLPPYGMAHKMRHCSKS